MVKVESLMFMRSGRTSFQSPQSCIYQHLTLPVNIACCGSFTIFFCFSIGLINLFWKTLVICKCCQFRTFLFFWVYMFPLFWRPTNSKDMVRKDHVRYFGSWASAFFSSKNRPWPWWKAAHVFLHYWDQRRRLPYCTPRQFLSANI